MLIFWIIVFLISLFFLAKSADYFTDSAAKIGTFLRLPQFVTGVLIVSFGTATPELFSSFFGALRGEAEILPGNITGTIVVNILLGLGLAVVLAKRSVKFNWDSVSNDMPFMLGSFILLCLTLYDGYFGFYEAILFLLTYVIYVIYSVNIKKKNRKEIREDLHKEIKSRFREDFKKFDKGHTTPKTVLKVVLIFVVSLVIVLLSAKYMIESLISIATLVGWGTSVLAASIVAIGTSLPEISVAVASAKKGNFDLSIGNIMGANIFDALVVFGVVGLFFQIPIPGIVLTLVLPMVGAVILIQWLVTIDRQITVTEGLMMTMLYITFLAKLFNIF